MKRLNLKVAGLLIVFTLLNGAFVLANDTPDDKQAELIYDIANNLRCPTCQGLSVAASQSEISANMKQKIKQLLDEGKSREEIYDFFEIRYGEWILREPRQQSYYRIIWLLPGTLMGLCAIIFVVYVFRKEKKRRIQAELEQNNRPDQDDVPDDTEDPIEKELSKLRRSI